MVEPVIGIDLGTTNSEVSFVFDTSPQILENNDNGILPSCVGIDSEGLVIVGGSTRIPMVSELLKEKLDIDPSLGIDPDLCVALGAGIQAGREMGKDISSMLIDITPYTFGTAAYGGHDDLFGEEIFVPLIKRNTKLPASRTEAFQTIVDNQQGALIKKMFFPIPVKIK